MSGAAAPDEARERVARMTAAIVHRGPDDDGVWESGQGDVLAMRRLSIIDLAGGHQPMVAPSGTAIVYNGEIYNYAALRERLAGDGWQFRTSSDTEVVLALYELHGVEALDQLAGMFAIAVHDGARGRLHLVRDRMGKKPLYYTTDRGELLFASEVKALLAGLPARPALSRQALHDYLTLRYVPGPETVWEGIRKLPPGHRLEVDLRSGERRERRWWSLHFESGGADDGRGHADFARLFEQAVDERLEAADVPVGVLLSGGLDSSAVSAAAVERGHRAFHTFSVGFADGGDFSELAFARQVADHVGARHHEVVIDRDDFVAALPGLVEMTDEPLADLATVPLNAVARLAREHVKVVLSGEGSDEVLAGYDIELLAARLERLRRLDRLPRALLRAAARLLPGDRGSALGHMGVAGWSGLLRAQRAHMTHVFGEDEKHALWRDRAGLRSTDELIDGWYAAAPSPHPVDQLQEVYCGSWLVEDLLMKADKATMATSLELRCPFLDHRLVEWAARAPLALKVGDAASGWRSKRVLRDYAADRLPRSIVERPKRGFPVPAYGWLADGLGDWAADRIGRAGGLGELFDRAALREPLRRARAGDRHAAHQAWSLLVLDFWLERWAP